MGLAQVVSFLAAATARFGTKSGGGGNFYGVMAACGSIAFRVSGTGALSDAADRSGPAEAAAPRSA